MLDTDTKRRIDTARDILVGKVPDPKSQVEQITIALIYKFMDDMDADAEELGGKRKFFAGDFARYGWTKLMRSGLGGHETLHRYAEAIAKMPENPGIPPLFREIFKNAYLPYRDPETLREFLKVIDEFTYDHSERLGDAFEYLLSVLGSQGDAGQFRTPRHIIDFIVAILDPKKDETVLDPACGTAGFLISSYKHILEANRDADGNSTLTPDDRARLAQNFRGYDISPDMVRLSLVNLYLHGFTDPHIAEYDTLTSQDRWNEHADVILANPPFMSPKGGIKPHNRFSVQSKRSEVLFVDYIAEHLTPNGRAGVIVPEGVIFQSQTAYAQLRKVLVEDYLVAVISLPAGVFNPYSGVKTSILVLDKSLARQAKTIAFFKIENDGFGLGAQRREIDENDLPLAYAEITEYVRRLRAHKAMDDFQRTLGLVVPKETIAASGDYNLSGERYREGRPETGGYGWHKIETLVRTLTPPMKIHKTEFRKDGRFPIIDQSQEAIAGWTNDENALIHPRKPLVIFGDHTCVVKLAQSPFAQGADGIKILETVDSLDPRFLFYLLRSRPLECAGYQRHFSLLRETKIPVPPRDVQEKTVAELESYQRVVDGARAIVDSYRPLIRPNPSWPVVPLHEIVASLESGVSVNSTGRPARVGEVGILKTSCVTSGVFDPNQNKAVVPDEIARVRCPVRGNTIIISRMNTEALVGASAYVERDFKHLFLPDRLWQAVVARQDVDVRYVQVVIASDASRARISAACSGTSGSMKNISKQQFLSLPIPLPPLEIQRALISEIGVEQAIVASNRELIVRFEKKIHAALARICGEDGDAPTGV